LPHHDIIALSLLSTISLRRLEALCASSSAGWQLTGFFGCM
jgi:hypothetical protein